MKIYKLEKLVDGIWRMQGTYSEKFVPQMASAIGDLYLQGFRMYQTMRITEVGADAAPDTTF